MRTAVTLAPAALAVLALLLHEAVGRPRQTPAVAESTSYNATDVEPPATLAPIGLMTLVTTDEARVRIRVGAGRKRPRAEGRLHGRLQLSPHGAPVLLEFELRLRSVAGDEAESIEAVLGPQRFSTMSFRGSCISSTTSPVPGLGAAEFAGSLSLGATTRRIVVPLQVIRTGAASLRLIGAAAVRGSDFGLPRRWSLLPFSSEAPLTVAWDLTFGPSN